MKILIIDIETTGFLPTGKIVEIGLVSLDLETGEKAILWDRIYNPKLSPSEISNSWIVSNGYMKAEDIINGCSLSEDYVAIQSLINSFPDGITAYNRSFDINFMEIYGFGFIKLLPCPMLLSTDICAIKGKYGRNKWPKAEEAHRHFYPERQYVEKHRGADDAMHEAEIIFALHNLGKFI